MPTQRSLTLADLVSLSRLLLAAAFVAVAGAIARLVIIFAAAVSDFLDGWLARRRNEVSPLGAVIDPATDHVFVLVVVGTLLVEGTLTWTQTLILMARDIVTTAGVVGIRASARLRPVRLEARYSGKVVTTLQFVTLVGAIAVPGVVPWMLALVAAAGIISIVDYCVAMWRARAIVPMAAFLLAAPLTLGAQGFPRGGGAVASAERRVEARLDAFVAESNALHAAAGLALDAGTYVRLAGIVGVGAADVDDRTVASGRVELIGRFLLDPFRQARWGLYGGTGVLARYEDGPGVRGYLTLLVGAELPGRRTTVTAVELGIGSGARIGVAMRRGRPGRR